MQNNKKQPHRYHADTVAAEESALLFVGCLAASAAGAGLENKGFTVGALGHGGVHFVCADHDLVKRAEVFALYMMGALLNGAGNTVIGLLCFHDCFNHPLEIFTHLMCGESVCVSSFRIPRRSDSSHSMDGLFPVYVWKNISRSDGNNGGKPRICLVDHGNQLCFRFFDGTLLHGDCHTAEYVGFSRIDAAIQQIAEGIDDDSCV